MSAASCPAGSPAGAWVTGSSLPKLSSARSRSARSRSARSSLPPRSRSARSLPPKPPSAGSWPPGSLLAWPKLTGPWLSRPSLSWLSAAASGLAGPVASELPVPPGSHDGGSTRWSTRPPPEVCYDEVIPNGGITARSALGQLFGYLTDYSETHQRVRTLPPGARLSHRDPWPGSPHRRRPPEHPRSLNPPQTRSRTRPPARPWIRPPTRP